MICFNEDMSRLRRSGVQPAATSEESKILVIWFSSSAILKNQNERPKHLGLCIYIKNRSLLFKKKKINLGIFVA